MDPRREALADRVRALVPRGRAVREVSMFGGLAFMVDDAMAVSVGRDGTLLVRTDPARHEELLAVPGAEPAVMGERSMGPGWLAVSPEGLGTDEQLSFWIAVGLQARPGSTSTTR